MRNYYIIDSIKNQKVNAFLLVTTVEDIYYDIDELLQELSEIYGFEFSIIIDHFITNGFSFNRFVRLDYFNNSYKKSLVNSTEISDIYDSKFIEYLRNNKDLLNDSSLSDRTKAIINENLLGA